MVAIPLNTMRMISSAGHLRTATISISVPHFTYVLDGRPRHSVSYGTIEILLPISEVSLI